ncbi:Hypothetical predicted protein [Lecanosticta acicola]|uniref:Uncharacterized protein n=1 Tax=Lecanosticta acicola TaxID=111012 RepID=A0AAI9EFE7_9PEZI|nr:Hypothetical predicted protein [Lecanosticta acicola]
MPETKPFRFVFDHSMESEQLDAAGRKRKGTPLPTCTPERNAKKRQYERWGNEGASVLKSPPTVAVKEEPNFPQRSNAEQSSQTEGCGSQAESSPQDAENPSCTPADPTAAPTVDELNVSLNLLLQFPPDHQLYGAAIQVLAERHMKRLLESSLPVEKITKWLSKQLRKNGIGKATDRRQIYKALRDYESPRLTGWLKSTIPDEGLLGSICKEVLDSLGSHTKSRKKRKRSEGMLYNALAPSGLSANDVPADSVSSEASGEADSGKQQYAYRESSGCLASALCLRQADHTADFDREYFLSSGPSERTRLVKKYFREARDLFSHHALRHIIWSMDSLSDLDEENTRLLVESSWEEMAGDDQTRWGRLLSAVISKDNAGLCDDEATTILNQQGFLAHLVTRLGKRPVQRPLAASCPSRTCQPAHSNASPEQPTEDAGLRSCNSDRKLTSKQEAALSQPQDTTSSASTTLIPFVTWPPVPGTFTFLLPISGPGCPIADPFPAEAEAACKLAFGPKHAQGSVSQLSPHVWIARVAVTRLTEISDTLNTALWIRGFRFQPERLPIAPPRVFEADFSEMNGMPSSWIPKLVLDAFENAGELPEIREEQRSRSLRRRFVLYFQHSPRLFRFYMCIVLPMALGAEGREFVATFKPRDVHVPCWLCAKYHSEAICRYSKFVPYTT